MRSNLRMHLGPAGLAWVLILGATTVAVAMILVPKPTTPAVTPGLSLDRGAIAAVLNSDLALASRAPTGASVDRLQVLWLAQGLAERVGDESQNSGERRIALMAAAVGELERTNGSAAVRALRARYVQMFERGDGIAATERENFLGGFPQLLQRYGLSRQGELIGPPFVVRTAFKARWNTAYGLAATTGLEEIERQAYWGWLALETPTVSVERRLQALDGFAHAGGRRALEARGVLMVISGNAAAAIEAFEEAYATTGNIRLRNYARGAAATSAAVDD